MSAPSIRQLEVVPDDNALDALLEHCLAVHTIIAERGTPTMRRLIDLLLFEIGSEIGGSVEAGRWKPGAN